MDYIWDFFFSYLLNNASVFLMPLLTVLLSFVIYKFEFSRLLFKELMTQKWFKSAVMAYLITLILNAKDIIASAWSDYGWKLSILIFIIAFIRYFISDLLKGENYPVMSSFFKEDWIEGLKVKTTKLEGSYDHILSYDVEWVFEHRFKSKPSISIEKIESTRAFEIKKPLEVTEYNTSSVNTHFKLDIEFNFRPLSLEVIKDFEDEISAIEVVATTKDYEKESIRFKIMYFFCIKLKQYKWLSFFI